MKKFALGILSIFMVLGGVLLSACDKEVSLSVSESQVELFTNWDQGEKTKEIEVDLENSSAGINVEIDYGQDCIEIDRTNTTTQKSNGNYAFRISTKAEKNSGYARVKVSAVDDSSKFEYVEIVVNTIVEDMNIASGDSEDGKSNLFAVKGVTKNLVTSDYFDLQPDVANIRDIEWSFGDLDDDGNLDKTMYVDGEVVAEIGGTSLLVYEGYNHATLDIVATYSLNSNITRTLTFDILENSTIEEYEVQDIYFYRDGSVVSSQGSVSLKRNNSNLSVAEGRLVLNVDTDLDVMLSAVVYRVVNGESTLVSRAEYEDYFIFDFSENSEDNSNQKIYDFQIDAIDNSAKNVFGDFEFYLQVEYAGYNYAVSTYGDGGNVAKTTLNLQITYAATSIDLYDGEGYSLNNTYQDVFSSYETGLGYQVETIVGPTDVSVDDRYFKISIDTNQANLRGYNINSVSDIANFYTSNGNLVTFNRSGTNTYESTPLESGTSVFVTAGASFDVLEDIEIRFESNTYNTIAYTSIYLTFYKISDEQTLMVTNADDSQVEDVTYISSSVYSSRQVDYTLKISGITTESGLMLKNDGVSGFDYPSEDGFRVLERNTDESYIIVSFSVNLTSYRFSSTSSFWFEHITGKQSAKFSVEAFVPIDSLVVQNDDKSSSNVVADISQLQNYLLENNAINEPEGDTSRASTSLSRLMVEAGATLPLSVSVQNATLTANGISYRYMSFEQFVSFIGALNEKNDDETDEEYAERILQLANEAFTERGIDAITNPGNLNINPYRYFSDLTNAPFTISDGMLTLSSSDFKGFVVVIAEGYDEEHETVSLLRIFALESFYSVRYLSSNVRNSLLYTADTLSISDMNRSVEDVTLTMRQDDNVPTYADSLEYFSFESGLQALTPNGTRTLWVNDYYEISDVVIANGGRNLTFRITAKSTNLQTSVNDILRITYFDSEHNFTRTAEIQLELRNEKRLESVQWVNRTADGEIYLNLTSSNASEKNFTISTSVEPSDANDIGLTSVYHAMNGSANDISITTSSVGQIFNVNINTDRGGSGYLYLLPNDMVKNVDGYRQILVYKYTQDENGEIKETPIYIPLSSIHSRYDEIINGSDEISNYFYNNDGEEVYYSEIILRIAITIADGNSEGTAIRVYNQDDLEEIDTAKYYRVMNDITLSGWRSYQVLSGMIYGNDSNVILRFTNGSEAFVNNLSGTIKDLTFVGEVTASTGANAGFIANAVAETGLIENCVIDVYYENIANNYYGSTLTSSANNTGAVAGLNNGTIRNVFVYGASISAKIGTYIGGIVGENNGLIEGSGFEFYKFRDDDSNELFNTITSDSGYVGGVVGFAGGTSVVNQSYVYAYALPTTLAGGGFDYDYGNLIKTSGFVGVFAGASSNGARFSQSFGFIGNVSDAFLSSEIGQYATLENSYVSYYSEDDDKVVSDIYKNVTYSFINGVKEFANATSGNWMTLSDVDSEENGASNSLNLDSTIWNLEKTDSDINFGYIYLRNISQSVAVNIDEIDITDYAGENDGRYRVLKSEDRTIDGETFQSGILLMYNPTINITNSSEKAMLDNLNTISIATLFGITDQQARSLLLTTNSSLVSISSNSIRLLNTSVNEFDITVHSKMDFTQNKTFKVMILNVMPQLSTVLDGISLQDEQIVLLQKNQNRTISYNTSSSLYLDGSTAYALQMDNYSIEFSYDDASGNDYVMVTRSGNKIILSGLQKHLNDERTTINTNLKHDVLSAKEGYESYANALNSKITRTFSVRVYEGAESLDIINANNLIISASDYASFDVQLKSDDENDNLVFGLQYGEVEIAGTEGENFVRYDVDSKLSLDVSWTKTSTNGNESRYRVLVSVSSDKKHLVDSEYSFKLLINAESQQNNTNVLKSIDLKVETQDIEDFSITTYSVERRQIRNSILYLTPSSDILNTLAPASDAIVSVSITPEYALMTHFTLTYEVSGSNVGTVGISKLAYNSLYGYYLNSSSTTVVENGICVNLTETDKTGDGLFYFRLYISSSFSSTSGVRLVVRFYNGVELLSSGSMALSVSYMQDAVVRVNDDTTYLLSKGETATVTVRVGINQTLYNLYLQNNESNITLTTPTYVESGNYRIYTAELMAGVDAKLVGGQTSGIFYVCASVERVLNGVQEIKVSRATVCLVDFSVDTDNISVSGSDRTSTYNGRTYDVFNAYINDNSELHFDYSLLPTEYNYDQNDRDQVAAVEALTEKRNQFLTNNYYYDENVGYYINYVFDEDTGEYNPVALKQQLWYATSEGNVSAIYNENRDVITQNDYFSITEQSLTGGATRLMISGKRAGTQLMMLRTIINYQGIEIIDDYYFLVVVEVWSDEETPTQITTAEEFIDYATSSDEAGDYILMNDIVLSNYTPLSTTLFDSLDGNGFTIHINSFAIDTSTSSLSLALFNTVTSNTTLRNVRVNIYNGGQISINIGLISDVQIAGFAIRNEGIIYNCEVVSYYDENYQISRNAGNSGLVVKYTNGTNTDPIALTQGSGVTSVVSGFVIENMSSIMNSRVGGESFTHVIEIEGVDYLTTQQLDVFYLEGQGEVSGFVNSNTGYVSASFVKNVQIDNIMAYSGSITSGFAVRNSLSIQSSYVEGLEGEPEVDMDGDPIPSVYHNGTSISANGIISGFIYENNSLIKNSYANIAIENSTTRGSMVAGFVYRNNTNGTISLCYAACEIALQDVNQMQFSGVDDFGNTLNTGSISLSYFYNASRVDDTMQTKVTSSVISVSEVNEKDSFYGFSFASGDDSYDGIWAMTDEGITLVSANQIAISNRYATTNGNVTSIFYSRGIRNADTLEYVDLSYGGEYNPIIIRNAEDFAKATGSTTVTGAEISSYKEYYTDTEVTGRYRIVNNIDMTEIAQDAEDAEGLVKLTTAENGKVFRGILDGNGFTISGISLGSSKEVENYGLFARLQNAVIMNLDITVESVHNTQANVVGVLAGTALDSRILSITLSPVQTGESERASVAVQGNNIVGGVVGMMFGESYLSDITVNDVDVSSESYEEGKAVGDNDQKIDGDRTLRSIVEDLDNGASFKENVSNLSYAGAISGLVDMYLSEDEAYVSFSTSREVSDFDIVTVRASNSVNVYAEVAGGLFGYVGKSTMIYDATVTINENMNLSTQDSTPSYIISKNLYAGGLVGENYGGLFAVSASYEQSLQADIDASQNSYYNNNTSVERGQLSIFSLTPNDEGYSTRTNNPLFIGGLVGYMGGGYIYVGYNKLNVIAHSEGTVVGGVVGLSGASTNRYSVGFTTEEMDVNILYYEVYASGDTYSDTGFSGGIIGALEKKANVTGIIGMKNVMAMNYYSYTGTSLNGDTANVDTTYTSDNHYMLVGRIYDCDKEEAEFLDDNTILPSSFYLINSTNDVTLNLRDGSSSSTSIGAFTVGGYKEIKMGSVTATLDEFGFISQLGSSTNVYSSSILVAQHIGSEELSTPESVFSRMRTYFLVNGWDEKYWNHEQNTPFPIIDLLPKVNVQFWDVYNTEEVLQLMEEDSSLTIVVRGRVTNDETDEERKDIDLTDVSSDVIKTISNFTGRLISYEYYMNTESGGRVTQPIIAGGTLKGGNEGDRVGIILNQSLFENISDNASIEGLTFYMYNNGGKGFSLVSDEAENSIFRDLNLVIKDDMEISSDVLHTDGGNYKAMGLVTGLATSTSFYNINLTFNTDATLTFNANATEGGTAGAVYVGLLAGRIRQSSAFSQMTVSGISFSVVDETNAEVDITDSPVKINVDMTGIAPTGALASTDFYVGIFAGEITKTGTAKSTLGISQINGAQLSLSGGYVDMLYVGGFAGRMGGADEVTFAESQSDSEDGIGLEIMQNVSANTFYAGLAFGYVGSTINFELDNAPRAYIIGKIIQGSDNSSTTANIGGLIGYTNAAISVSGLKMKFDVAGNGFNDQTEIKVDDETTTVYQTYVDELSTNQFSYDVDGKEYSLGTSVDNSVGAVIGYANGGSLTLTGENDISGNLIIKVAGSSAGADSMSTASVSGFVGKVVDCSVSVGGQTTDSTNIYVAKADGDSTTTAPTDPNLNIGGVAGYVDLRTSATDGSSASLSIGEVAGSFNYTGSVITSNVTTTFGGAVGQISTQVVESTNPATNGISISNMLFGGALRVLAHNSGKITAGGIVGKFDWTNGADETAPELTSTTITNSLAYGDVFVIYQEFVSGTYRNDRLDSYTFGGIVGSAQSGLNITNCFSLLTNFNSRGLNSNAKANVGAIVGENSDSVTYEGNKYSSIVTMTYQEEGSQIIDGVAKNQDYGYGAGNFSGYTTTLYIASNSGSTDTEENNSVSLVSEDILGAISGNEVLRDIIEIGSFEEGSKLNPYKFNGTNSAIQVDSTGDSGANITGNTNGIKWVAVDSDENLTIHNSIASDGTNFAIVGNGRTIERESGTGDDEIDASAKVVYKGGLVDKMGVSPSADEEYSPTFNLISGFIISHNTTTNFVGGTRANAYGGVVGYATGNSFIYGVGVKGDLYVGGNSNVRAAGIVGEFGQGLISQCYVDANITYGAQVTSASGVVSGIANMINYNSAIKATYSSGKITSYVDTTVYTFAYAQKDDDASSSKATRDIEDCYSITQVEINDVLNGTPSNAVIYFAGNKGALTVNGLNQVINGTANATATETGDFAYVSSDSLSLSYDDGSRYALNSIKKLTAYTGEYAGNITQIKDETGEITGRFEISDGGYNTWYFSRLTNYGYASHAFGYLKNSTTYVYVDVEDDAVDSGDGADTDVGDTETGTGGEVTEPSTGETTTDTEKEYRIVPYSELVEVEGFSYTDLNGNEIEIPAGDGEESAEDETITIFDCYDKFTSEEGGEWYFGVPSVGKFDQMLETVSNTTEGSASIEYDEDYKFVLRYGFDLKDSGNKTEETGTWKTIDIGQQGADRNFVLDGGDNTINLSGLTMTSGIFGTVTGSIQNLRIINGNVTTNADFVGLLANGVTGHLTNITAVGNISTSDEAVSGSSYMTIGGIVGSLMGDGSRLESLVNITNTQNAAIIGGVVGHFSTIGTDDYSQSIEYATNSGVLVNNPSGGATISVETIKPMRFSDSPTPDINTDTEAKISLHGITGGIVGITSDDIKNSYNTNSVLSNYYSGKVDITNGSETHGINVVSGGIVGYMTYGTIDDCVNASLVGSGTYESEESYSYAGGIVGYATNVTMTDCVNDGPVQALGKENGKYKIIVTKKSRNSLTSDDNVYATTPMDLIFQITMVYNPGEDRHVTALGLGFSEAGSIDETNYTSTNNIKNDGNIGEISVVSYLVFDRSARLDNVQDDDGNYLYEARFENTFSEEDEFNVSDGYNTEITLTAEDLENKSSNLYISGYDSYGFPARVYSTETISRRLSANHPFYKQVYNTTHENDGTTQSFGWYASGFVYGKFPVILNNGEVTGFGDFSNTATSGDSYHDQYGLEGLNWYKSNNLFTDVEYRMEATTTYYASSILGRWWGDTSDSNNNVNFDGYDGVLQRLNNYTYIVGETVGPSDTSITTLSSDTITVGETTDSISEYVNCRISEINAVIEGDSEEEIQILNVGGQKVGVARTASNLITILNPYSAQFEDVIEFKIQADASEIDWGAITKDSIRFTGATPQYVQYDIIKDEANGTVTVVRDNTEEGQGKGPVLYYDTGTNGNVTVSLNYQSTLQNFSITQNNATISGNTLTIDLTAIGNSALTEELTSDDVTINSVTILMGDEENEDIVSSEVSLTGNNLVITSEGFEARGITQDNIYDMLNGKSVSLEITERFETPVNTTIDITTTNKEEITESSEPIGSIVGGDGYTYTFTNYEVKTINVLPTFDEFVEVSEGYRISEEDFLAALGLSDAEKFAYTGVGDYDFMVYREDGRFGITDGGLEYPADSTAISTTEENGETYVQVSGTRAREIIERLSETEVDALVQFSSISISSDDPVPDDLVVQTLGDGVVEIFEGVETIKGNFRLRKNEGEPWEAYYNSNNMDNFISETDSDGVSITTDASRTVGDVTIGGFRSIDVTFSPDITATISRDKIPETDIITIQVRGSDGGIKQTINLGGWFGGSARFDSDNPLQTGDTITYTRRGLVTNYTKDGVEFEEEFELVYDGEYSDTTVSSITLSGKNGSEYVIIQGRGDTDGFTNYKYVTTTKTIIDGNYMYRYSYTVWDSRVNKVEVTFSMIETDGEIGEVEDVEDAQNMEEQEYTYGAVEHTFSNGHTMRVDVISLGFDEDEIWFEKNEASDGFSTQVQYMGEEGQGGNRKFELFAGNEQEYTISADSTTGSGDRAYIEYSINGGETIILNESSKTFEGSKNGYGDYEAQWFAEKTRSYTVNASITEGEALAGTDTVLLANDINMGDRVQTSLDKNLVGTNYVLRFVSSWESMFTTIGSNIHIKDTILVGSNAGVDGVNGIFAGTINSNVTISNVKLFGTIRNIGYNNSSETGTEIFLDYASGANNLTENNITMVGLNNAQYDEYGVYQGGSDDEFSVKFKVRSVKENDRVIMIAGDSVKGNNGENTYNVVKNNYKGGITSVENASRTATSAVPGSPGQAAVSGGSAESSGDVSTESYAIIKGGQSGIGGYGGDGSNGTFSNRGFALGGGAAGEAGGGKTSSYVPDLKQLNGNPGVGGFGRIEGDSYSNFTLYTSGNSGDGIVERGANGQEISDAVKYNTAANVSYYAYFGSLMNEFCNSGSGDTGKTEYRYDGLDKALTEWGNTIKNNKNLSNRNFYSIGGVSGGNNGSGVPVYVNDIYLYAHAEMQQWWIWWEYTVSWSYTSWPSGETVNSAGQITFVNGGNPTTT